MESVYEYIPLLLCDVPEVCDLGEGVAHPAPPIFHAFGGSVHFRSCIFHATIVGRLCDTDAYHKYVVDDGTRALEMQVYRRRSDLETVNLLQQEVATAVAQDKQISDSLMRLLTKSTEQLSSHSNISVGRKVLVHGRPTVLFQRYVGITAFSVCSDGDISRDVEIAFKDYLIDWYVQHKPASLPKEG